MFLAISTALGGNECTIHQRRTKNTVEQKQSVLDSATLRDEGDYLRLKTHDLSAKHLYLIQITERVSTGTSRLSEGSFTFDSAV